MGFNQWELVLAGLVDLFRDRGEEARGVLHLAEPCTDLETKLLDRALRSLRLMSSWFRSTLAAGCGIGTGADAMTGLCK